MIWERKAAVAIHMQYDRLNKRLVTQRAASLPNATPRPKSPKTLDHTAAVGAARAIPSLLRRSTINTASGGTTYASTFWLRAIWREPRQPTDPWLQDRFAGALWALTAASDTLRRPQSSYGAEPGAETGWRALGPGRAPATPTPRLTARIARTQASRDTRNGPADEDELAQLDDYVPVRDDEDAAGGAPSQDVTEDDDAPADEEEGEDLLENMHKCVGVGAAGRKAAAGAQPGRQQGGRTAGGQAGPSCSMATAASAATRSRTAAAARLPQTGSCGAARPPASPLLPFPRSHAALRRAWRPPPPPSPPPTPVTTAPSPAWTSMKRRASTRNSLTR
jgi:hypothetical protein